MDKLVIRGNGPLDGEIGISGAKNAALPMLAAALLSAEPVTLTRVPQLRDVSTMIALLRRMGVAITTRVVPDEGMAVTIDAASIGDCTAPYDMGPAAAGAREPLKSRRGPHGRATVPVTGPSRNCRMIQP